MQKALYLIPVTLGQTDVEQVIPSYNVEIFKNIHYFIVENIRSARRFLRSASKEIDIDKITFYELNEHTDVKNIVNYLEPLEKGHSMGLISEAGCPAVADPGADIVALAQKRNLKVIPLSGPSSILMSIMASGLGGQNFAFNGYLPAKQNERENKIRILESKCYKEGQTQIFIETPYRNSQMIESLLKTLKPQTKLCIAAGITLNEEFIKTKDIATWKKSKIPDLKKIPTIFLINK